MRRFISTMWPIAVVMTLVLGCGRTSPSSPEPALTPVPTVVESGLRIVVLGDSLAAGLGLPEDEAFPAVLETHFRAEGFGVKVVNAGVSGDTTAGGLRRLGWVLGQKPDVMIVELGGNDALRGQPLAGVEANLREIVRRSRDAGAAVVVCGMDIPSSYGPEYSSDFAELFERVAVDEGAILVPGFVRKVGLDPTLLQPDGLHPTAEGHRRLADALIPAIRQLL